MATGTHATPEIEYPSADGEPMAETPVHRDVMIDLIVMLTIYFADEPEVYVSGNMMVYYVVGNADKWVSPDVFVTHGIHKMPERETYKLWVEGKGPDAVIEVTSKSTRASTSAGSSPFTATCSRCGNISCSIPGKRRWLEFHFAATGWLMASTS